MKFSEPNCPECGKITNGVLERLYAWASISRHPDDPKVTTASPSTDFDYSAGGSKMDYDSQEPDENAEKEVQLKCSAGHEWTSHIDYTAEPKDTKSEGEKAVAKPKEEFRDVKVGKNLVARVYRSGKVTIGVMCGGVETTRIEVEATIQFKEAREFFERSLGMVNVMDGRYDR